MTYRKLLRQLQNIPDERLDDTVTVHLRHEDEFYAVANIEIADEDDQDVLDDGHLYLVV